MQGRWCKGEVVQGEVVQGDPYTQGQAPLGPIAPHSVAHDLTRFFASLKTQAIAMQKTRQAWPSDILEWLGLAATEKDT